MAHKRMRQQQRSTEEAETKRTKVLEVEVTRPYTGSVADRWASLEPDEPRARKFLDLHLYSRRLRRVSALGALSIKYSEIPRPALVFNSDSELNRKNLVTNHTKWSTYQEPPAAPVAVRIKKNRRGSRVKSEKGSSTTPTAPRAKKSVAKKAE